MIKDLYKKLYFQKINLMYDKGIKNGDIELFNDYFYNQMRDIIIFGIPVSFHIKYLKPSIPPGKCFERSLYMFFCFDNAVLVRASVKQLELRYGKDNSGHGWIEMGDYVYDPSYLCKFKKELYYKMFEPYDIYKCSKEEYLSDKSRQEFYTDTVLTKKDYMPAGKKAIDLVTIVPLLEGIVNSSDFREDLDNYLNEIEYDKAIINNCVNKKMQELAKKA